MRNLRKFFWMLRSRDARLWAMVRRWLWSDSLGVGMQRPLDTPMNARRPRIPLTLRPIQPGDSERLTSTEGVSEKAALYRLDARRLIDTGIRTLYVAVTEAGEPVYMQCLARPDQNDLVPRAFGGLIAPLEPDDALLEFAYTLEDYRAAGIMPWAVSQLAEKAREDGAKRLVIWISVDNLTMERYFRRVGFVPFASRRERYRFGRRTVRFGPLEPGQDPTAGTARAEPAQTSRA
jgi:GNAT superfamily N-acetyltransferase